MTVPIPVGSKGGDPVLHEVAHAIANQALFFANPVAIVQGYLELLKQPDLS